MVATPAAGLPDCPGVPAIDPVSGDLFVGDVCSGYLGGGGVTRIENPASSKPTLVNYGNVSGVVEQLAFAPDGTLYAVNNYNEIDEISATDSASPGTVTPLVKYTSGAGQGVAVTGTGSGGAATQLTADDFSGNIFHIDLTQNPPVVTNVAAPGTSGDGFGYETAGPDGCVYVADDSELDRFGQGGCGNSGSASSAPSITLAQTSGSSTPATGTTVGLHREPGAFLESHQGRRSTSRSPGRTSQRDWQMQTAAARRPRRTRVCSRASMR